MNRTVLLICSLMLLCLATTARAASINATSCSNSDVQTAINSAVNGDIVLIPAGTCAWTAQVTIPDTKGITLQGAGIGYTVFQTGGIDGIPSAALVIAVASGNTVTRVTGFTMDEQSIVRPGQGPALTVWGNGLDRFRVDHVSVRNTMKRGFTSLGNVKGDGSQELSGLFDHVECHANPTATVQCFNTNGGWQATAMGAFTFPVLLGSNHAVYIEDSLCDIPNTGDDCLDNFQGHSFVFRYNTLTTGGPAIGNHGADSSYRGGHLMEAYRNNATNNNTAHYMQNWRSGPNVSFDNTYTGNWTNPVLSLYRAWSNNAAYGAASVNCNGTTIWDKIQIPAGSSGQGWGCLDQTGWYFPMTTANGPTAGVQSPAYIFNNTLAGVDKAPVINFLPDAAPYLVNNRDYYTSVGASCSGTSCTAGIGIGTLASRPANCTTGVGYWATDQGTWNQAPGTPGGQGVLYKCTATNTWSLYYTPYTYPHPLQSVQSGDATPPAAPTNLRVQ